MSSGEFIPYTSHHISDDDIGAVLRVLKGAFITQGPNVDAFEKSLIDVALGKEGYFCCVNSGTAALHLACLAAEFKAGDAVFVPSITFAASSNAVLYTGATPYFVDIEQASYGLCPKSLEEAIAKAKIEGLTPRGVIPVQYAGLSCDMGKIWSIAEKEKLKVIEDCCHALGGTYRASSSESFKPTGTHPHTFCSAYSFHAAKHICAGEGGGVYTSNVEVDRKLRRLRSHGITKDPTVFVTKKGAEDPWYYEMLELGWNYRIPDVLAALGTSQLLRFTENILRRKQISEIYQSEFKEQNFLKIPPSDSHTSSHAYHLFPLLIDFRKLAKTRAQLMTQLKEDFKIGTQVHYIPVETHPYYQSNRSRWSQVNVPQAHDFYSQELSIPMYHAMTDGQVERVVTALKKVLK